MWTLIFVTTFLISTNGGEQKYIDGWLETQRTYCLSIIGKSKNSKFVIRSTPIGVQAACLQKQPNI